MKVTYLDTGFVFENDAGISKINILEVNEMHYELVETNAMPHYSIKLNRKFHVSLDARVALEFIDIVKYYLYTGSYRRPDVENRPESNLAPNGMIEVNDKEDLKGY
jgi:hypothetical protein